ncbi:MAG: SDR family oxidoreductase [Pseudomonadota bacterium]
MEHINNAVTIITGASRGIGAATARYLAARGGRVVLGARSEDAVERVASEIRQAGGDAAAAPCDVTRYDQIAALVALTEERFGPVDALVNNAGLIDPIARLTESDPAAWGQVVDTNVKGVYHGLRAVLPGMAARGRGTVVNISSGASVSALEGWSHYCSTKAGVLSLTRCAAREMAGSGVTVVGLSPGTVATDMQTVIRASGINSVSALPWEAHIPPDWVARAIAYLMGPGGPAHAGTDFSLKTDAGRREAGLPLEQTDPA